MADLLLNNRDALSKYGVHMGKDFVSNIAQPGNFKTPVSNKSRLEDGTRYTIINRYVAEREVTLAFVLIGRNKADTDAKLAAFYTLLGEKIISVKIPSVSASVYHLVPMEYSSFSRNIGGTLYSIKVKFKEPNPNNRA